MKFPVRSVEDLALLLRAVRKSARVRQDDLAATAGVSKQFAADVERGKPTVQLGLVLKLLSEAGVTLNAEIPDSAAEEVDKQRAKRNAKAHAQDA
ncbi:helix-turn-helix domain-containing protein [Ramlibacter sp. WS9]|uniref:helix-turn-helix domain-containing protein n=1 Tax=Ramlibacter sp. WS9 TaxID=1882741 RepID=UPI001141E257|nr:helix-turn-helix domain-containing protein [Ramlibacter sp. WS9]ROZ66239.1 transcriptional regulator [Ramlibacter sp. WS9]